MKMTITQAFEAIYRGETPEQYEKRLRKIRRLANERDSIEDWLSVFDDTQKNAPMIQKKRNRLEKVEAMIRELA